MSRIEKIKEWIRENAPMLTQVYENKYVGMVYDRFLSLESKQQRQVIYGVILGILAIISFYLLLSYSSVWGLSSKVNHTEKMKNLLMDYQKFVKSQGPKLASLERNSRLAPPGEFKRHLMDQAKMASISPKLVTVEEKNTAEGEVKPSDVHAKQATVVLDKVNLSQLKNFLTQIEFGAYSLSISSIRISNDDKLRGYMKVEIGIVAYLFQGDENSM